MARTTKEQAQRTREKLIETAIDVFYESGVSATTLDQVAEAAGLTRGAIYWHFKNKPDLVSAVHEHFHIQILDTIQQALQNLELPPLERMRSTWRAFLHTIATNEMYRKVMAVFMLRCDYSGEMNDLLLQQLTRKKEARLMIAACFQNAIDAGELRPLYTAEQLAQTHMCYMHGIMYEYIAFNRLEELEHDSDRLIDFYFNSLPRSTQAPQAQ